jgi:hypothetical protein
MTLPANTISNLSQLTNAINRGASIAVNGDGTWHERWEITKLFRWIFGWETSDNIA